MSIIKVAKDKTKKLKPTKIPNPHVRKIVISLKLNSEEMRDFISKAHGNTAGNISEMIRYAVKTLRPRARDYQK